MTPQDPPSIPDEIEKKRHEDFARELTELCQKHKMYIVPVMEYSRFGAVPQWITATKEEYDKIFRKVAPEK